MPHADSLGRHVCYYAEATQRALADGYTGLRVAANVTPQVLTPVKLAAFARYEHLVDRYMVNHPLSALFAVPVAPSRLRRGALSAQPATPADPGVVR